MQVTACTRAINMPAPIAATRPIHGFPVVHVTDAAVNAPASIIASSAMLMTPARSEKRPPIAARMSGVASRIDEPSRTSVKTSATPESTSERRLGRHEQNDQRLQNLD